MMGLGAFDALAVHFDIPMMQVEFLCLHFVLQRFRQGTEVDFLNRAATVTDHKLRSAMFVINITWHISVERFNAVNKAVLRQEVERAIGRWRLGAFYVFAHAFQYFVRSDRLF